MQAPQLIDNAVIPFSDEPVTLPEIKQFSLMDADYAVNDADLERMAVTARIRIENYLNKGLVNRTVSVVWDGRQIELPLSPTGAIEGVKKNVETDDLATDKWVASIYPAKTIYVKEAICFGSGQWWYSRAGYAEFTPETFIPAAYTVTYATGYDVCPIPLKQGILIETDALYKLKGTASPNLINPNTVLAIHEYSRNLILL